MPEMSYNKKIDHDLGIPLQDDYFYNGPEEIIETNQIEKVESDAKISETVSYTHLTLPTN